MPQIFRPQSNTVARASIALIILVASGTAWAVHAVYWSPYTTRVNVPLDQPAPFSHKHHVGGLGIDCRYCHGSVETSAFAGMPATETCMTCHSQVWKEAPILAPVRLSLANKNPIHWNRVNDLPDFVFFNHSIHVRKGIGCSTCHGRVDEMPLMWRENSLYMKWCLDCHRAPEKFIRPHSDVFNLDWVPSTSQQLEGKKLIDEYHVPVRQLTDCSICHR